MNSTSLVILLLVCQIHTILCSNSGENVTTDIDEDRKRALAFCEKGLLVSLNPANKDLKTTFHIPWAPRKDRCQWSIIGSPDCEVDLTCFYHIPARYDKEDTNQTECAEEYLKISDGTAGSQKFCGKGKVDELRASGGLRDLFVKIEVENPEVALDESQFYRGVDCTATCKKPAFNSKSYQRLPTNLEKKVERNCVCGFKNDENKFEYPWQAAIVEPNTRIPKCGASAINDRFFLTAAHCIGMGKSIDMLDEIEVLLHAHLLEQKGSLPNEGNTAAKTDEEEETQRYKVIQIFMHPLYTKTFDFDIALLKVDRKINITEFGSSNVIISPICLPRADLTWNGQLKECSTFPLNWNLTIAGWGKTAQNAGGSTSSPQKLSLPYIPFENCVSYLRNKLTPRMLCAGPEEGEQEVCTGDSGGPLIYKMKSKQHRQVGVVSFSNGCATAKKPGIYTKTVEVMQWIDYHTAEHGANWCQETI